MPGETGVLLVDISVQIGNKIMLVFTLKGQLHSKNKLSSNERARKMQKRDLTDFNAPNGYRDISFQIQEFEQDGSHHFEGFSLIFT